MAENLKNPNKPAHEVVEVYEDGSALRNDGIKLKSAQKNPWYVLATIYGEQQEVEIDEALANQNQRIWNGWLCGGLGSSKRSEISKLLGVGEGNLHKLTETQVFEALEEFRNRIGDDAAELPNPNTKIDFSDSYFEKPVVFENHAFVKGADFSGSIFFNHLNCRSAVFNDAAVFKGTIFKSSSFYYANFLEEVEFSNSKHCGYATFFRATFSGGAMFRDVTFYEDSTFANAVF